MGTSLFFQLFAGVPMDAIDTFPLIPLGRWLLPIGIYILLISLQPCMDRQNRRFVVIRYGMVQKWWKNYFVKNIFNGGLTAVIMLFLFKIFELLISQRKILQSEGNGSDCCYMDSSCNYNFSIVYSYGSE